MSAPELCQGAGVRAPVLLPLPLTNDAMRDDGGRDGGGDGDRDGDGEAATTGDPLPVEGMSRGQALSLYTSHALSTWNARTYEFAAIVFTASAYPDTLTASSIRGITTTLASICLSSSVGRWIDNAPNRLRTLLFTISVNRAAIISACALWFFLVSGESDGALPARGLDIEPQAPSRPVLHLFFAIILCLGIFEKLSATGNIISMERDWVVCLAAPSDTEHPYDLTQLNSVMRRIDLICKLIAPIVISTIVGITGTKTGVMVVGGMSAISWGIEIWSARRVWNRNEKLRLPKVVPPGQDTDGSGEEATGLFSATLAMFKRYAHDFKLYFSTNVWIPSMSLALLHLSCLSYSATFITFMLSVGFSLNLITVARAAGSVVEISSTIVTPFGVQTLGKHSNHGKHIRRHDSTDERGPLLQSQITADPSRQTETGLERFGLWGITWQLANLIPVVLAMYSLPQRTSPDYTPSLRLSMTIFVFLSLSRLGLWIFDLTTQQLTQSLVASENRSSFTGVQYSFSSFFELGQYVATMVFSRPDQFKWLAVGSVLAVAVSAVAYAGWVRAVRGHLVHWQKLGANCGCAREGK